MMSDILLSICIPSYNRDAELKRLLESIDATGENADRLEIVIREDMSPKRKDIARVVDEYKQKSKYPVRYIENEENFGYDRNIRSVADSACGEWVIFMGDDDLFVPGALDKYMCFLKKNDEIGYVLRRYRETHKDGSQEDYRYAQKNIYFEPGEAAIVELFRRSLFISGFTFRKRWFIDYGCTDYDGSLLFQLYILSCICKDHKSCYCDIPITEAVEGGTPYFGKAEAERELYDPGYNSIRNSLNFMGHVKILAESIDKKLNINITEKIMVSYSKYSYGFLHEHRDDGIKAFNMYVKGLRKMGFNKTYHFSMYYCALLILGKRNCKKIIMAIKKIKGNTPRL